MNTTEQNQAREEYFHQILTAFRKYDFFDNTKEVHKATILAAYDKNAAIQKRVDELEAVILALFNESISLEETKEIAIKAKKSITKQS